MSSHYQICVDRIRCGKFTEVDETEPDSTKPRFVGPTVWCRLSSGYKIQELTEPLYLPALDLLKHYYLTENVLCKTSGLLDDYISRRSYYNSCLFRMRSTTSLAVIDEGRKREELAGICLLRPVKKVDFGRVFSRTILRQGEAYNRSTDIKTALNRRVDIYADYDCEIFLRFYLICIKPDYRDLGLGTALMRTAANVARALKIPIMMGLFDSLLMQQIAMKNGFSTVTEIRYSEWKDEAGNVILKDVGEGNETLALMIAKVEQEVYPDYITGKTAEPPPEEGKKKGKKDKKDKKGKKGKK